MNPKKAANKKTSSITLASRVRSRWVEITLAILILLGFGLRMVDLTDPPLDFHPTRQFHGAIVARSIYYELAPSPDPVIQEQAVSMRHSVSELEPSILESIVAFFYLLAGSEYLWIARIIVSLIWVLAAIPLLALAHRFVSSHGALLVAAYYLFLPFGVIASRSFQPDPVMVSLLILGMFAVYRWSETRAWRWAITAAICISLAILIKAFAIYFGLGVLAAVVLSALGFRKALRDKQVWAIAAICLLPSAVYYLLNIGATSGGYIQNWIVALLPLAFEPGFYVRWVNLLVELLGVANLVAALAGILIAKFPARWLLIGAWAGYALYGITLPHQTTTHDYYHLFLVPLAALSMAPVVDLLIPQVIKQRRVWQIASAFLIAATIFFAAWSARSTLLGVDYRDEPPFWQRIGAAIPTDGETIGLVQSYGNLLTYYGWRRVELWPITGELYLAGLRGNTQQDFETFFLDHTAGMDYFLVTAFNQLDQQPMLADRLNSNFPVLSQGDGYIIYDLRTALNAIQ